MWFTPNQSWKRKLTEPPSISEADASHSEATLPRTSANFVNKLNSVEFARSDWDPFHRLYPCHRLHPCHSHLFLSFLLSSLPINSITHAPNLGFNAFALTLPAAGVASVRRQALSLVPERR